MLGFKGIFFTTVMALKFDLSLVFPEGDWLSDCLNVILILQKPWI